MGRYFSLLFISYWEVSINSLSSLVHFIYHGFFLFCTKLRDLEPWKVATCWYPLKSNLHVCKQPLLLSFCWLLFLFFFPWKSAARNHWKNLNWNFLVFQWKWEGSVTEEKKSIKRKGNTWNFCIINLPCHETLLQKTKNKKNQPWVAYGNVLQKLLSMVRIFNLSLSHVW